MVKNIRKQQPKKQPNNGKQKNTRSSGAMIAQGYKNLRVAFDVKPGNRPGSVIVRGTEYVGRISGQAVEAAVLQSISLNPACFPGRLSQYAKLFDKFIFLELSVHYTSACPSTQPGSLALVYEGDPSDQPPASAAEMLALPGCQTKLWQDVSFRVPQLDKSREYFMGLDSDDPQAQRFTCQGQVFALQFVPVPEDTETPVGDVTISYVCHLYEPVLHPASLPAVIGPNTEDGNSYTIPGQDGDTDGHKWYKPFVNAAFWQSIADNVVATAGETLRTFVDSQGRRWLQQIVDARTPPTLTAAMFASATAEVAAAANKKLSAFNADLNVAWNVALFRNIHGVWSFWNQGTPITNAFQFSATLTDTVLSGEVFSAMNVDCTHFKNPVGTNPPLRDMTQEAPGTWSIAIAPYFDVFINSGTYTPTQLVLEEGDQRLLVVGSGHLAIEEDALAKKKQTPKTC